MPKEETFPIPQKYIDETISTYTDLDVMQEERIDDYWNVDTNRSLSDSWKGFTKFKLLKETPPKRFLWFRRRLTKVETTTRPYHVWPEVWTVMRACDGMAPVPPCDGMVQDWKSRSQSRKTSMEE